MQNRATAEAAAGTPEDGLAAKLHRQHVEAGVETDDELRVLPLDGLHEPVAEVPVLLHADEA